VRKARQQLARQADHVGKLRDPRGDLAPVAHALEPAQGFANRILRGVTRIEAVGGILEHHLDLHALRQTGKARRGVRGDVLAVQDHVPRTGVEQAGDDARRGRLAAARLAYQPQALAALQLEGDPIHRAKLALGRIATAPRPATAGIAARKYLHQIDHLEQGVAARRRMRNDGGRFAITHRTRRLTRRCSADETIDKLVGHRGQVGQIGLRARRCRDQLARVGVGGMSEQIGHRRRLHDLALLHHGNTVAVGRSQTQVVRDQHHRHVALAGQVGDQVHRRLLRGHIQPGRGLVRDQQARIARQRHRDHHALAHPARKLEGIGVVTMGGVDDAHLVEHLDRLFARGQPGCLRMAHQHVFDLTADGANRIECGARILENHRDLASAQIAQGGLRRTGQRHAVETGRATGGRAGGIEQAEHGIGGDRFAGAALADHTEDFTFLDRERNLVKGTDDAVPGAKLDRQTIHRQQGMSGHGTLLRYDAGGRPGRADRRPAG